MLRIYLMGHPQIFDEDVPLPYPTPAKVSVLWAYLLLKRRRPIPRDYLAYTLWPDATESDARANLRRHLHLLRKYLPAAPPETPWILSARQTIQWNPEADYELDVAMLEAFDETTAVPDQWTTLIESYQGDLLAGFYDDWILAERARLRQRYGRLLQQYSTAQIQNNDLQGAVRTTKRLLIFDPLCEETCRQLMTLQYRAGDRAAALETFRQCQTTLQTELGIAPSPETQALRDAIRQTDDRPAAPPFLPPRGGGETAVPPPPRRPFFARFPAIPAALGLALLAALIAFILLRPPAFAEPETVTLSGPAVTQNTWLNNQTPDTTYDPDEGPTPYHQYADVHLMYFGYPYDRVLIRFNLAQLPAGARVDQAVLRLHLADFINDDLPAPLPADLSAFRLLRPWQPETATFNAPWSQPGLAAGNDYDDTPLDTRSILSGGPVKLDVTTAAQTWVSRPEQNHGLLIMLTAAPQGAHYWFYTANYPLAGQRPQLQITYAPPK